MQSRIKSIQPSKTHAEIEAMREGGKILAIILSDLKKYCSGWYERD